MPNATDMAGGLANAAPTPRRLPGVRWLTAALDPTPGSAPPFSSRYELLDGVRGLAALAVVLAHHGVAVLGHEAVLVFFVVSGYCVAGAAATALRLGTPGVGGFRAFLWRRARRIYPPYLLSLGFFAATRIARQWLGRGDGLPGDALVWLQNVSLTQWLTLLHHPAAEPVQNPALLVTAYWSLNYEEQFYLVVATALLLCGSRVERLPLALGLVTIASSLWLVLAGSEIFRGLFLEFWPHFAIGAGLFVVLCHSTDRRARTLYALGLAVLLALSGVSAAGLTQDGASRLGPEFALLGLVGLVLLLMRPLSPRIAHARLWKPLAFLGTISYSLYLVHQFNLTLANGIAAALSAGGPPWLRTTLAVGAQLGIASVFWYLCERPFLNRAPAPAAAAVTDRKLRGSAASMSLPP